MSHYDTLTGLLALDTRDVPRGFPVRPNTYWFVALHILREAEPEWRRLSAVEIEMGMAVPFSINARGPA